MSFPWIGCGIMMCLGGAATHGRQALLEAGSWSASRFSNKRGISSLIWKLILTTLRLDTPACQRHAQSSKFAFMFNVLRRFLCFALNSLAFQRFCLSNGWCSGNALPVNQNFCSACVPYTHRLLLCCMLRRCLTACVCNCSTVVCVICHLFDITVRAAFMQCMSGS